MLDRICTHINDLIVPCPCSNDCSCKAFSCRDQSQYLTNSNSQPQPRSNNLPNIKDLVISDMFERAEFGKNKYGTYLQPFNSRDSLKDVYQELLDATIYIRQLIYERDNK